MCLRSIGKSIRNLNRQEKRMFYLALIVIAIIGAGLLLAYYISNFTIVPFTVVVTGIVTFFGVLIISNEQSVDDPKGGAMRKAITVAIVVVYLGLLPTLAFQGIIQYQVLDNNTLNQSLNQTTHAVPVDLSETVISSFTALVTAVVLFYFGSRTWENVKEIDAKEMVTKPSSPIGEKTTTIEKIEKEDGTIEIKTTIEENYKK